MSGRQPIMRNQYLGRVAGGLASLATLICGLTFSTAASAASDTTTAPEAAAITPDARGLLRPRGPRQFAAPTLDQIPVGSTAEIEQGRRIYHEGILPDGKPLTAKRLDGEISISGQNAACVLCHRRSGLGAIEGNNRVSPISGRYLFRQDARAVVQMNVRTERGFNRRHDPYTLETLSAAIRGGIHVSGRELGPLMPRYAMSERDVQVLASYLRQLSAEWSPGVTDRRIRYATVITPDVDARRKQTFIETMRAIMHQRNGNVVNVGQRTMSSGAEQAFQTNRYWDLDVWELTGPPDTWAAQLKQRYDAQPVFALISGLGGTHWAPVHQFCETNQVPCWFPSVQQVPEEAEDGFYSMYYSRGVSLEADVLGRHLGEGDFRPRRVLQVYSDAGIKTSVVQPFKQNLDNYKITNDILRWDGDKASLGKALEDYTKVDAVVFWLDAREMKVLADMHPPASPVYFSGQLARGELAPLNTEWKRSARLVYPYQLPDLRQKGLTYFHQWLNERKLPLTDELMQSEVYFSLTYLVDTLVDMLDNVHRDFLLERGESNLSWRESANAENQSREIGSSRQHVVAPDQAKPQRAMIARPIPRPHVSREAMQADPQRPMIGLREGQSAMPILDEKVTLDSVGRRNTSTTVYPRLSLAQFQRLASKGAYIVRFADPKQNVLEAESAWIVP